MTRSLVARNRNLKDAFLIGHNYRCEWTAVLLRLTTLNAFRERTSRTFFFAFTFYTKISTRRRNVTEKATAECTEITVTRWLHNTERILQVEKSRRRWLRRPRWEKNHKNWIKITFFLEFCKAMDVKKRQAFEHELRRLRREGDEIISLHAQQIRTTKTQDL